MSKEQDTEYYSITNSARKQLAREIENLVRIAGVIRRRLMLEGRE